MKKTYLSLIALFISLHFSYAQSQWNPSGPHIYNTNSGNVGIGTTSPASQLEIFNLSDSKPGGIRSPAISALKISRLGTSSYSYNESAEFRIGHGGPSVWGSQLDLFVNGASNQNNIPDQHAMTWLYNGNVGIGTSAPESKLDVVGGDLSVYNSATGSTNLVVGSGATGKTYMRLTTSSDINGYGTIQSVLTSGSAWGNTFINPLGGDVGIGTTDTKGYRFAVNGAAIATSMKVKLQANWPDFVFKKDYKLPPLTEVKDYIDRNQHLPDMPSADEVHTNGLDLGEMNRLLLKKVEELTLYLIEKDQKITNQERQITEQQQRMDQLEQQSARIKVLELALMKLTPGNQ